MLHINKNIEVENGVLKGVILMEVGEAKGHGCIIDLETLQNAFSADKSYKAFINHSDITSPTEIVGIFNALRITNNKELRADFTFLESFKKNYVKEYETLLELAQKYPDQLGISLKTNGYYVDANGEVTKEKQGSRYRITEITSCDFVDNPAATTALFNYNKNQTVNTNMEDKDNLNKDKEDVQLEEVSVNDAVLEKLNTIADGIVKILSILDKEEVSEELEEKEEDKELESVKEEMAALKKQVTAFGASLEFSAPKETTDFSKKLDSLTNFKDKLEFYRANKDKLIK